MSAAGARSDGERRSGFSRVHPSGHTADKHFTEPESHSRPADRAQSEDAAAENRGRHETIARQSGRSSRAGQYSAQTAAAL